MDILKITLIQFSPEWENRELNLVNIDRILTETGETDLIILPEMFTTGFSMDAGRLGETMLGETVSWMRRKAGEKKAAIAGSIIIKEKDCI